MCADERFRWVPGAAARVSLDRDTRPAGEAREALDRLLSGRWSEEFGCAVRTPAPTRVDGFRTLLRQSDDVGLFRTLAYNPRWAVTRIGFDIRNDHSWATVVDLYEACWLTAGSGEFPGIPARGQRMGSAYLARTRYLLLSWPFRSPPVDRPKKSDWANLGDAGEVMVRARQARDDWLTELDRINDYPRLAEDIDVECDIRQVVDLALTPAALTSGSAGRQAPTPADRLAWRHCLRRHLLPRFALPAAWWAAWRLMSPWARRASVLAIALFVAAVTLVFGGLVTGLDGIARVGWAPRDPYGLATLCAGFAYLSVAVAAVREPAASWPWLLRQPAAAAVGVLALAAMDDSWWGFASGVTPEAESGYGWVAVVSLLLAGSGYLFLEAVNHGVSGGWRLLLRTGGVLGTGLLHALVVGVVALRWIFPGIAEQGHVLAQWWVSAGPSAGSVAPSLLVCLATAWSFASGVFLQSLWQDQPITAPLSHVEWRGGR